MTDEELIEQIARTVGQKIEGAAEDMDSVWYGAPLWAAYIEEARAILPFIHADREAVRAEQAAELAKFKALAETLAGALATAASCLNQCAEGLATQNDMETWAEDATQTLRQYKEARDEAPSM